MLLRGAMLVVAWANSPWTCEAARTDVLRPGGKSLHPDVVHRTAARLSAVLLFVVGPELRREFTADDLRNQRAVPPVIAAVRGVIAPAPVFLAAVPPSWFASGVPLRGAEVPRYRVAVGVADLVGGTVVGVFGFDEDLRAPSSAGRCPGEPRSALAAPAAAVPTTRNRTHRRLCHADQEETP